MPHHVIVDGSNLATEGRTLPSLQQLNEAVAAYRGDHPDALITVVVDATFGHRIDAKEQPQFEKAIETNAFVAPPAGAVGRGDGFILSIAQKAGASILSNDSYQEFHGEYAWLFDEGRLIGGKPVPHVGWVFVNRVPVRGPISRRSVKEQKIVDKSPSRGRSRKSAADSAPSISADGPMPVPKTPPPGAAMVAGKPARDGRNENRGDGRSDGRGERRSDGRQQQQPNTAQVPAAGAVVDPRSTTAKSTNDLLAFLSFVEQYPVGTAVTAVVESYSSHGAYVAIGDAKGYVPLRLMADPAPRSAREVMAIGETVTLVVNSFGAARRSIDLAVPAMAPPAPPVATPKARKSAGKKAAAGAARLVDAEAVVSEAIAVEAVEAAKSVEPDPATVDKPAKARATKKTAARGGRVKPEAVTTPTSTEPPATFDTVFDEPAPSAQGVVATESSERSKPVKAARSRKPAPSSDQVVAADPEPAATSPVPPAKPVRSTAKRASKSATTSPTRTPAAEVAATAAPATASARSGAAKGAAKAPAAKAPAKAATKSATKSPSRTATKKPSTTTTKAPAGSATESTDAAVAPANKRGGGRRPAGTSEGS